MRQVTTETRQGLADRLEAIAARIRAGQPIEVGGTVAEVPDQVEVELEIDAEEGSTELEIEVSWTGRDVSTRPLVGILTGSPGDLEVVRKAKETLDSLGIPSELRVLSAHRTPDQTLAYVRSAEDRGIEVIIACAGMAAHLAGVVAANSLLPVIGVPLAAGALSGMDALLSTVQMPSGIPVATVGIDGTRNAAFLAARILGARYPEIRQRLRKELEKERKRYETEGEQ